MLELVGALCQRLLARNRHPDITQGLCKLVRPEQSELHRVDKIVHRHDFSDTYQGC